MFYVETESGPKVVREPTLSDAGCDASVFVWDQGEHVLSLTVPYSGVPVRFFYHNVFTDETVDEVVDHNFGLSDEQFKRFESVEVIRESI